MQCGLPASSTVIRIRARGCRPHVVGLAEVGFVIHQLVDEQPEVHRPRLNSQSVHHDGDLPAATGSRRQSWTGTSTRSRQVVF